MAGEVGKAGPVQNGPQLPPVAPPVTDRDEPDQSQRDSRPKCADLKIGTLDGSGREIIDIYFKRATYVIYCTNGDGDRVVRVQYADDNAIADKQIAEVADIIPLRNQLQILLANIKDKYKSSYYAQIAEALRLGMEHKPEVAKQTLGAAITELQKIRASDGRNLYVNKAWPYAASGAALLLAIAAALLYHSGGSSSFIKAWSPLAHLLIAASGGALGALLSIALSVRARTVATDGDDLSIRVDAALRVLIGIISAGVLYLILGTGVLSQVKIGDMSFNANAITWQLALLAGFASGFLERLVPDMLEKKAK